MFVDESSNIARRARNQTSAIKALQKCNTDKGTAWRSLGRARPSQEPPSPLVVHPSIVIEDLALPCSLAHYVVEQSSSNVHFDIASNGCLEAGMKALGMARLTQIYGDTVTRAEARRLYMHALRLTNASLRSKSGVRRDSTLLTANVLSIFEAIMSLHKSFDEWSAHINGAATLLYLRGNTLFQTTTGGRLFMQTVTTLTINCETRRCAIPSHVIETLKRAEQYIVSPNEMTWRYQWLNVKVTNLQAETLADNSPRNRSDAEGILHRALEIDEELASLFRNPPSTWDYTVVPIQQTNNLIFGDNYHVYRHFLSPQLWNGMRGARLVLRGIMKQAIATGGPELLSRLRAQSLITLRDSTQIVRQLQLDILATIPQQLDPSLADRDPLVAALKASNPEIHSQQPGSLKANFASFGGMEANPFRHQKQSSPDLPRVQLSGGYILQWSLFIAAKCDPPGGEIRTWVVELLRMMSRTLGIRQALVIANMLEMDGDKPVRG